EIEPLPRLGGLPLGIEQPIAANEYLVIGLWQIGYQITALIVGYHDANELRRYLHRLGDHPHTGLGSFRTRDHAGDVPFAEVDRNTARLLSSNFEKGQRHQSCCYQS